MVVDSSVLVAILLHEPGHEQLLTLTGNASIVLVGTPTVFESAMVLSSRFGEDARHSLMGLLRTMQAQIVPFTQAHYEAATSAFLRFGKGYHPAALNFGDCMSYAVAQVSGQPLLYTGTDFSLTGVKSA